MKMWACTAILVLAAALPSAARQASDRKADDPAIRKLCDDYAAAYSSHDPKAAAEFYAPSGDRRTSDGVVVSGRAAIERQLSADFKGRFASASVKMNPASEIRYVSPTLAILDGSAQLSGVLGPDGQPAPPQTFFHTMVLVKRQGTWKILVLRNWPSPAR